MRVTKSVLRSCILFFILPPALVYAQPAIEWQKAYGNATRQQADGNHVTKVSDGYIFASTTDEYLDNSSYIESAFQITKIDQKGNVLWNTVVNPRNVVTSTIPVVNDGSDGVYYSHPSL